MSVSDCSNIIDPVVVCSNGSLLIEEVDLEDTGFYTCVWTNEAGVSQVSILVDVGVAVESNNFTG